MDLAAYLESRRKMVESALEAALPETGGPLAGLVRAMRYSLLAGGKRLRPVLCLAGAEAVGAPPEAALPAALALEMIHTYSLIHDDLPAMDNDDFRRGRPSNHKMFGEAAAILAGDALLTLAFQVMTAAALDGGADPARTLAAMDRIARAAGHEGMVGGQAVDMESQGLPANEAGVRFLHERKTAALIEASVASGAAAGGGGEDRIEALARYGRRLGLAFQITDDILDIEGDEKELGKPVGSDQAGGKATWPAVVGLEAARLEADRLVDEAVTALDGFGREAEPLRVIAEYLKTRKK